MFDSFYRIVCAVFAGLLCLPAERGNAFDFRFGARMVLQGRDALSLPGKDVDLAAVLMRVGGNGFPYPVKNKVIQFTLHGERLGTARTSSSGTAIVRTRFEEPGNYSVRVSLIHRGVSRPTTYEIRVCVAPPKANFLVIDIENTLHGVSAVRFPYAEEKDLVPLPGAVKTLRALSRKFSLIYLSSIDLASMRKLRAWMDRNEFPSGPVLFWQIDGERGDISGQKTARLKQIRADFPNLLGGIGHSRSDAAAFQENRMGTYLVNAEPLKELPTGAHRFNNWRELEQFLFPRRRQR